MKDDELHLQGFICLLSQFDLSRLIRLSYIRIAFPKRSFVEVLCFKGCFILMIKEHKKENRETFELFTRQADRLLSLSFSTFWRSATEVEIKSDTKNNGSCEKKGTVVFGHPYTHRCGGQWRQLHSHFRLRANVRDTAICHYTKPELYLASAILRKLQAFIL